MTEKNKNFWTSLPGILTGIAAVLTAATGLYLGIRGGTRPSQDYPEKSSLTRPTPENTNHQPEPSKSEPQTPKNVFNLIAVIDDPDGYTNVRSMKSVSSEIVEIIYENEHFYTYLQEGNWWQIKTVEGKIGYMHVSRIKIVSER